MIAQASNPFPLIHRFSFNSLVIMFVTAATLVLLYQKEQLAVHEEIIAQVGENAAYNLMHTLDDRIGKIVFNDGGVEDLTFKASSNFQLFNDEQEIVRRFKIIKLRIYNPSGKIIFSTNRKEIGSEGSHPVFLTKALSGTISHSLERYADFPGATGNEHDVNVALTFMPLTHEAKRIGAMEIYIDATSTLHRINAQSFRIAFVVFAAFSVLYAALFFYVRNTDINAAKWHQQIHYLAFNDALTGLPNRRLLNDRLEQTQAASKRTTRHAALLFLDLDNFKPVNDEYGHEVGDLLLQEAAKRISNCVRQADTVARFGGDEFVVLLNELVINFEESTVQAGIVAEKIRTVLAEPYMLKVKTQNSRETIVEHHCTSSIGVVLFLGHEGSASDIVKWADLAMYEAKSAGRNQIRYHKTGTDSNTQGMNLGLPFV
jgi:diguanylate cyclase (GGDEF)-like protein